MLPASARCTVKVGDPNSSSNDQAGEFDEACEYQRRMSQKAFMVKAQLITQNRYLQVKNKRHGPERPTEDPKTSGGAVDFRQNANSYPQVSEGCKSQFLFDRNILPFWQFTFAMLWDTS